MLKRRSLVLLLVVLMLAVPAIAAAASVVLDDNLDEAVREELGFTEADDVAKADMVKLKKLEVDKDVKKLDGLQYATKLEVLGVGGTFKDLSPIRNLPLKSLDLTGAEKLDLKPDSAAMKIIQDIQHAGAVVTHKGPVKRISGPDRYQTAVRVFQNMDTVEAIVLARGDDFADALAGAPLAAQLEAPILLTGSDKLHKETKQALIDHLNIDEGGTLTVYVLGGKAAISSKVERELTYALETELKITVDIKRISGDNRYETAVAIAEYENPDDDDPYLENAKVYIASGENYADALSVAPYAADDGIPILLTKQNELPECVEDYLEANDTINAADVIGGPAAVDVDVISDILEAVDQINVTRIWGADRYATAVKLADGADFIIATGENFADALTGAVLAAANEQGILLVKSNSVPSVVDDYLWENRATVKTVTILGGETAVSLRNAVELYELVR